MVPRIFRSGSAAKCVVAVLFILLTNTVVNGSYTAGDCVVSCAVATIGEKEIKENRSPFIDDCNRLTGVALGSPWCASVAAMWYSQCGLMSPMSAYSPDWFKSDECVYIRGKIDEKIKPGDTGGIYFPSKKRIAHLFLVESVDGQWLRTIEGNTSDAKSGTEADRNGDRVMRKKRLKSKVERISRHWDGQKNN
jgi:hypothetical protein